MNRTLRAALLCWFIAALCFLAIVSVNGQISLNRPPTGTWTNAGNIVTDGWLQFKETGGSRLRTGSVPDGYLLQRSGTNIVGVPGSGAIGDGNKGGITVGGSGTNWQANFHIDVQSGGTVAANGSTDDTAAIQAILTAAPVGSVIYFRPTTTSYRLASALNIAKPMTLRGELSVLKQVTSGQGIFSITASNVVIDGLNLQGPQSASYVDGERMVNAFGTVGAYLTGIEVRNCRISSFGGYGVCFRFVKNFKVVDNVVGPGSNTGITVFSSTDGIIARNQIDTINVNGAGNAYGVSITRVTTGDLTTDPRSRDIIVSQNTVFNIPVWTGLDTHSGQRISFIGNTVSNTYYGIVVTSAADSSGAITFAPKDCSVIGNTIDSGVTDGTRNSGIIFAGALGSLEEATGHITGNTLRNCGDVSSASSGAIYTYISRGLSISGNVFIEPTPTGIALNRMSYDTSIVGNTITDPWANSGVAVGIWSRDGTNFFSANNNTFSRGSRSAAIIASEAIRVGHATDRYQIGINFMRSTNFAAYLTTTVGAVSENFFYNPQTGKLSLNGPDGFWTPTNLNQTAANSVVLEGGATGNPRFFWQHDMNSASGFFIETDSSNNAYVWNSEATGGIYFGLANSTKFWIDQYGKVHMRGVNEAVHDFGTVTNGQTITLVVYTNNYHAAFSGTNAIVQVPSSPANEEQILSLTYTNTSNDVLILNFDQAVWDQNCRCSTTTSTNPPAFYGTVLLTLSGGKTTQLRQDPVGAAGDDQTAAEVPFTPAGTVAATDVQAAIVEVDTEKAPIASPTFTGTATIPTLAANATTLGSLVVTNNIIVIAGYIESNNGFFEANGDGTGFGMKASSGDGIVRFLDYAGTSFGRIQLGGITTNFPSIKRSGTTIAFRLADDSADSPITAGALTVSGNTTLGDAAGDTVTASGPVTVTTGGAGTLGLTVGGTSLVVMNDLVGIGTANPISIVDIYRASSGLFWLSTSLGTVSHGMSNYLPTNSIFAITREDLNEGGAYLIGANDAGGVPALGFTGVHGVTDPTDSVPAVVFRGAKKNGANIQSLGNAETVIQFKNNTTDLVTVLGNGNVGIGTNAPSTALEVVGVVKSSAGFSSAAINTAVNIATTGWTNIFGKNAVVMLEGVGVTYTIYNNAGTAVYTNVATVVNATIPLQVSGKVIVTAGTGVSGTAFPW